MKRVVPLLALVPVAASYSISGRFALPTGLLIVLFSLFLGWIAHDRETDTDPGLGLFWLAPLGVVWAISERREGRDVWQYSVPFGLVLAAIGTIGVLRKPVPKCHGWLVGAAVLTWCVSYFGGSSGAADNMRPFYSFFGLSADATWNLILLTRKTIHITFYSALVTCFYNFLGKDRSFVIWRALGITAVMACCDEWRQSMMPNRDGSPWDVLLDTGAASLWLWWRYFRKRSAKPEAPDSDVHA